MLEKNLVPKFFFRNNRNAGLRTGTVIMLRDGGWILRKGQLSSQETWALPRGPNELGECHFAPNRLGVSLFMCRVWGYGLREKYFFIFARVLEKNAKVCIAIETGGASAPQGRRPPEAVDGGQELQRLWTPLPC